jgi:hypothetical protein
MIVFCFSLSRAFLDYYDQWLEETKRRAEAVMYSKHDELDKEMDFQMHLHEPRRIRIEMDIHNVRAGNHLSMIKVNLNPFFLYIS